MYIFLKLPNQPVNMTKKWNFFPTKLAENLEKPNILNISKNLNIKTTT